jgi:hypothetical protein
LLQAFPDGVVAERVTLDEAVRIVRGMSCAPENLQMTQA